MDKARFHIYLSQQSAQKVADVGLVINDQGRWYCHNLNTHLVRVCECYFKTTAAALAWAVVEASLVTFTEFARNVQAKACAFVLSGEKRLKNILLIVKRYARTIIVDF